MIEFRTVDFRNVPWDELDRLNDRVVFQTREWLQFLAETQNGTPVVAEIRDGNSVAGYFTGLTFHKVGLKILGSSFPGWTTPYIGFNILPGTITRSQAMEGLERWALRELGCMHFEVSDRHFAPADAAGIANLRSSPYESYQSDLTRSEDELFSGMESACRRCIRKAEKSGVTIEHASDHGFATEYYDQLKDVFAKQGKLPTYSVDRVQALIRHMSSTGRILLVRARNPEGRCIATGIYPGFNDTAFFWGNASWRSEQHWRPNEALHWYAMKYWKAKGVTMFDWGGGGTYKEKYGVAPLAVPWFYKSRFRALSIARDGARSLFYHSQRLLGRVHGGVTDTAKSEPACG